MSDLSKDELEGMFDVSLANVDILYAKGDLGDYSESVGVIYRQNGELYEFTDDHCSCNGWSAWGGDPVTLEALKMRKYGPGPDYDSKEWQEFLAALEAGKI